MIVHRRKRRTAGAPGSRRLPWWKKAAFALVTTALFFVALEGVLALVGVRPVLDTRDPLVGFASSVPLYVESTDSENRAVMTTAPNKLEYFNAQRFLRRKPPGTYRIFCLGGSTTYGRPYDDTTSFPGWLREILPAAAPDVKWEVINAGGISYASYRVAALMEELVEYEPDLFIVYTGHNEFLEERTYGDVRRASPAQLSITALAARTRTYALVDGLLGPSPPQSSRFELPGEVDAVLDHTVGPSSYHRDDGLRAKILGHFEMNLDRMAAIARSQGAAIVFIKPGSNIKDCSPFKSQHCEGLDEDAVQRWTELFERGKALQRSANPADALAAYEAAEHIDDRFAELHFRKGRVLFRTNRLAEATTAFQRAVDEDVCPLRALSDVSRVMDRTARRLNVPVVDFEALLASHCLRNHGHNSPGREHFLDHVHPSIATNRMLAVAIIEELAQAGILDADLPLSKVEIARVTRRVEARIDPQANAVALRNLAKVLNWAGKHEEAGPLALGALETLPGDPESLLLAAAHLKMAGSVNRAIECYRKTLEHAPDYVEAHQLLGAALVERGDLEEARQHFAEVARIHPNDGDAHHMLGAILAEEERYDASLAHYRRAARLKPDDADVQYNLGFALAKLGRREEAIRHYRRAIELNPDDRDSRKNLAVLLREPEEL
ncbi:MAG: tetratricopeptide repeat protein [Planctomycetota bacterium]|jgi:tetratricopeptide (TPR) repeat protein/lysophospholipase L1-like esterase